MKIFNFLKSKTFLANLVLALLIFFGLFWAINAILSSYTHHGQTIHVPDLKKLSIKEVANTLETYELDYDVIDSSEFDPNFPRGSVIAQYPEAGGEVKEGRVVKLTLNPLNPRKIEIPQLIEKTKRRAIYDLESKGFTVGELSYVPYIGKDVVVDVKVNGRSIQLAEKFDKGTVVNLVLGQGLGDTRIRVPYLRWLTANEAREKLREASLNLGSAIYDEEVQDSALALIYKQSPSPSLYPAIKLGQEIDIWLTTDYTKIPNDSLKYKAGPLDGSELPDSLLNDTVIP